MSGMILEIHIANRIDLMKTIERLIDLLDAGERDPDAEPNVGWTEDIDQDRRMRMRGGWAGDDEEPEMGWTESHSRGVLGEQSDDDREGDDERDEDGDRGDFDGGEGDAPGFIEGGQGA